jgi:hypothetical protein
MENLVGVGMLKRILLCLFFCQTQEHVAPANESSHESVVQPQLLWIHRSEIITVEINSRSNGSFPFSNDLKSYHYPFQHS